MPSVILPDQPEHCDPMLNAVAPSLAAVGKSQGLPEWRIIASMALQPDDIVCFCFHVRLRKIESFCYIEKPLHASQISDCLSAGTGCGWCRPLLKQIHLQICGQHVPAWRQPTASAATDSTTVSMTDAKSLDSQSWAAGRQRHIAEGRGHPPSDNPRE